MRSFLSRRLKSEEGDKFPDLLTNKKSKNHQTIWRVLLLGFAMLGGKSVYGVFKEKKLLAKKEEICSACEDVLFGAIPSFSDADMSDLYDVLTRFCFLLMVKEWESKALRPNLENRPPSKKRAQDDFSDLVDLEQEMENLLSIIQACREALGRSMQKKPLFVDSFESWRR